MIGWGKINWKREQDLMRYMNPHDWSSDMVILTRQAGNREAFEEASRIEAEVYEREAGI